MSTCQIFTYPVGVPDGFHSILTLGAQLTVRSCLPGGSA